MRIAALASLVRHLSVREIRHKIVEDISATIQWFALVMLITSAITVSINPQLYVMTGFVMLSACLVCAIVYLANGMRDGAGTALWFAAVISAVISTHLSDPLGKILMIAFAGICMWLMWYVTPWPRPANQSELG